jgi:methylenetetrahydrofolate dehydrogenase (NADP+)/methenyltetrahydrofolate cyclohydrolase
MKYLIGTELAEFIKERQAKQVRGLRQAHKIIPRLAIVLCNDGPVSLKYTELKEVYGGEIGVEVDVYKIQQNDALKTIGQLNNDKNIHGIIVQLPLISPDQTDEIVAEISPSKDVDGLNSKSNFDSATAMAIIWLLTGYNIDLIGKVVTIVGRGRLVGAPLKKMLEASGTKVQVVHSQTEDPKELLLKSKVIISAAGKPGMLKSNMIPERCVVVDAATASEGGQIKGDLADDVYSREDLTLTPKIGGVGPLTVCALFDNVIRAAQKSIIKS